MPLGGHKTPHACIRAEYATLAPAGCHNAIRLESMAYDNKCYAREGHTLQL